MINRPLVSVIIPCYNYGRYLNDAVQSVLHQSFQDLEIIIINDGSTDDTKEIALKLVADHPNHQIHLINQANSGQPAISRNNGINHAVGKYILPLDADDTIALTMLEECVKALDDSEKYAIAYTDRFNFYDSDREYVQARPFDSALFLRQNHIPYCALYRKIVWDKVGGYRLNVKGCEDWDFWVAAIGMGFQGYYINQPLFQYRLHGSGLYLSEVAHQFSLKAARVVLNNQSQYSPLEVEIAFSLLYERAATELELKDIYYCVKIEGIKGFESIALQLTSALLSLRQIHASDLKHISIIVAVLDIDHETAFTAIAEAIIQLAMHGQIEMDEASNVILIDKNSTNWEVLAHYCKTIFALSVNTGDVVSILQKFN